MNAVQQEVAQDRPTNRARPGLEVDEQDDVAEYLEARPSSDAFVPSHHGRECQPCSHLVCPALNQSWLRMLKCLLAGAAQEQDCRGHCSSAGCCRRVWLR